MVWLPWKSKKKALETTEKSRETQESSTPKKATPAREDAAASKPAAAPDAGPAKTETALRPDALLTPCYRGDAEKVEELVKMNANLNATDALGNSPLHLAAFNGHLKVISVLLEASADPCYQNGELDTPLYMAVLSNSLPCVKLISEKLSDENFNCANVEGFTPLHYAAGEGNIQVTKYLVEACGCDPEFPDNLGLTPGFCAVLQGRKEVAEYLLQMSPEGAKARNMASDTMLHCALKAQPNNKMLLQLLIDHGSDITAKGADGMTSEEMLVARHHQDLVEYSKTLPHNQKQPEADQKVHHVPHPVNAPCPWLRKYIADKIDSGSEMPAKPVIIPDILQEEWEFVRSKR
eukprot:Tamp_15481.p1 GENE.Tamp_15481~~Tamp_15481.p1  ORF type:complete len:366 (-),score=80.13 Tamp_15481:442-1488(-)